VSAVEGDRDSILVSRKNAATARTIDQLPKLPSYRHHHLFARKERAVTTTMPAIITKPTAQPGREAYVRITHTWKRFSGVWKITAGMSADELNR
jgi:hypothetical protein